MYCPTCGQVIPDGASYCSHCGTRIIYIPSPQQQPAQRDGKRMMVLAGIAMGLAILGFIISRLVYAERWRWPASDSWQLVQIAAPALLYGSILVGGLSLVLLLVGLLRQGQK